MFKIHSVALRKIELLQLHFKAARHSPTELRLCWVIVMRKSQLIFLKLWRILKHYFTNVFSRGSPPPSYSISLLNPLWCLEWKRVIKPSWLNINVLITGILITSQLLLPPTLLLSLSGISTIQSKICQQSISLTPWNIS